MTGSGYSDWVKGLQPKNFKLPLVNGQYLLGIYVLLDYKLDCNTWYLKRSLALVLNFSWIFSRGVVVIGAECVR